MRTENQIVEELQAARAEYHGAANAETAPQLAQRSDAIKALMAELSATLAAGAAPCPRCGTPPHGRLMTPTYVHRGSQFPAVYAVQCLKCTPSLTPTPGKPDVASMVTMLAKGASPAEAVAGWNSSRFQTESINI